MQIVLNRDGLVEYMPLVFSPYESEQLLQNLAVEVAWRHDKISLFGKRIITKRKVAWYGNEAYEYIYSNQKKIAKPWTKTLELIKNRAETVSGEYFNSCLLNYYHNGNEAMGWHSDNETMMKKHAAIASISFGAVRTFQFRHKTTQEKCSVELGSGSLLLMKHETQDFWKHQLPPRKRIQAPRINLTFRYFKDEP